MCGDIYAAEEVFLKVGNPAVIRRMGFVRYGDSPLHLLDQSAYSKSLALYEQGEGSFDVLRPLFEPDGSSIIPQNCMVDSKQSGSVYLQATYSGCPEQQCKDAGFVDVGSGVYRWDAEGRRTEFSYVVVHKDNYLWRTFSTVSWEVREKIKNMTPYAAILLGQKILLEGDGCKMLLYPFGVHEVSGDLKPDIKDLEIPSIEEYLALLKNKRKKGESRESPGFTVGGKNPTSAVRALEMLNGIPIHVLEERMRPGNNDYHGSQVGFLGEGESLRDVMARDNDFVLSKGLTHQEIARHLHDLERASLMFGHSEVTLEGRRFHVSVPGALGPQYSPFYDGIKGNGMTTIVNLATGKEIKFAPVLPAFIYRYGFYEGRDVSYRLDPRQILEVLDFLVEEDDIKEDETPKEQNIMLSFLERLDSDSA